MWLHLWLVKSAFCLNAFSQKPHGWIILLTGRFYINKLLLTRVQVAQYFGFFIWKISWQYFGSGQSIICLKGQLSILQITYLKDQRTLLWLGQIKYLSEWSIDKLRLGLIKHLSEKSVDNTSVLAIKRLELQMYYLFIWNINR